MMIEDTAIIGRLLVNSGKQFRQAVFECKPLAVLGVIDAYAAKLAQFAGAKAIYLSGAGVANAYFGLPDLAMTTMTEVVEAAQRITSACSLPLLVDIDTGFGSVLNIARTIQLMERSGVAAVQIEDQGFSKRCGHRDGKQIISCQAMQERIRAAVDARDSKDFVIMARTDALYCESPQQVLERVSQYVEQGADMIFLEAIQDVKDLEFIASQISVPILVNSTEFGKTPIQSQHYWYEHGAKLVLYPLSAFRAASHASLQVYKTILQEGSQTSLIPQMQNRQDLYEILNYMQYEEQLNQSQGDSYE
jgi:methylisocitrate lyase